MFMPRKDSSFHPNHTERTAFPALLSTILKSRKHQQIREFYSEFVPEKCLLKLKAIPFLKHKAIAAVRGAIKKIGMTTNVIFSRGIKNIVPMAHKFFGKQVFDIMQTTASDMLFIR
jgi:hypothetical protein